MKPDIRESIDPTVIKQFVLANREESIYGKAIGAFRRMVIVAIG